MITDSPLTRARDLLRIHGKSCSVVADSPMGKAFAEMAQTGEVRINPSGTPGYIDIYAKNFRARFTKKPL